MSDDKRAQARRRALEYANSLTDEEDARITAAALADPDAPPVTAEMWARAVPYVEYRRQRLAAGAPPPGAQLVSLHIDTDVLDHFVNSGPGWRARINEALRRAAGIEQPASDQPMQRQPAEPLEAQSSK